MYRIVFLVVSSFLLWGCKEQNDKKVTLPYYNEPTFTPIFEKNKNLIEKNISHKISNFSFLNQDSVLISQKEIEDKIHIASFIFTSCGSICPTMTNNLKTVSNEFKKNTDIVLLSYSVTPWIDKPNVLKKFKKEYEIDNSNWHFLTGNKADIYKLARQSYFAEEDIGFSKDSTEFLHTEHIILVDKTKRIRGIYNGTLSLEMQNLIADIKALTEEEK
jgi:protein SCO1